MTNLKGRLHKLESQFGFNEKLIYRYRLEPDDWKKIRFNKDIFVVVWHPDKDDNDRIERLAEIDELKKSVARLGVVSQYDGYAVWENGKCIKDGGLGYE